MKTDFVNAMKIELVFEGSKVDDSRDPGGRTNQGVTQRVYSAWRLNNDLPVRDVYQMIDTERDTIYDVQYAKKIKFDDLPSGIDVVMLDCAVNSGVAQAVKWVQRALGAAYKGKIDGIMGEGTFGAIKAAPDYDRLVAAILDRRLAFLKALKTWDHFGKGWTSRVEQVRKIGQAWATGSVGPIPIFTQDMHRKAEISDAKTIPYTAPSAITTGVGGTVAAASVGVTGFIGQIKQQLANVGFLPHVDQISVYLDHASALVSSAGGIAGIAIGAGGCAWLWYARRRAADLHDALDTLPSASAPALAAM